MGTAASVSVIITSRNRSASLLRAVGSVLAQSVNVELLVVLDATEDGSERDLRSAFPTVDVLSDRMRRGPVVQRNRAAALTTAPILVWLDDDAELTSRRTLEQTCAQFEHPRVGAVGIPYTEPRLGSRLVQRAPAPGVWLTDSFMGCCGAVRRQALDTVGELDESLFVQGEEPDLCARLLGAGWVTALGVADPAVHHVVADRRSATVTYYATRNQFLVPIGYGSGWPLVRDVVLRSAFSGARAVKRHNAAAVARGMRDAASFSRLGRPRHPLPRPLHRLIQRLEIERLRGRHVTQLHHVEARLPALAAAPDSVTDSGRSPQDAGTARGAAPPSSPN